MTRRPYRPPARDGLNATRLVLPHEPTMVARFATTWEYLCARFPDDVVRLGEKVGAGEVRDGHGGVVGFDTAFEPRGFVYVFRDPAPEPDVPFGIPVLFQDENLVVVDKPHFLATTPRGAYVQRSVVVRLRRELGNPELSPVHRLDRLTAGVLVLTARAKVRGAYQQLFDRRQVRKVYEAVAPWPWGLAAGVAATESAPGGQANGATPPVFPVRVRSRMIKERGELRAREIPGEPNAESLIDVLEVDEARGLARYRLEPHTGKTHQLRLHMASLGIAICDDNFYPELYDVAEDDYSRPLQLVARSVQFTDPLSGQAREFATDRELARWKSR